MSLPAANRLGAYEFFGLFGARGKVDVYQPRDASLDRTFFLKQGRR